MGVILAIAVALDALVVRLVLLPVILRWEDTATGTNRSGSGGSSRSDVLH